MDFLPLISIEFLVVFPLIIAALLLVVRNDTGRAVVVIGGSLAIIAGCVWIAVNYLTGSSWYGAFHNELFAYVVLLVDAAIGIYIIIKSIQHKRILPLILIVLQFVIIVIYEFVIQPDVVIEYDLYIDTLSVIMALIIGVIGCGICIYSLGYMKDFQEHENAKDPEAKDRRPVFFSLMFLFLSAMFGIVFSNNLSWLMTAWELTTVCSFALIGYTRTAEAIDNSFRQIVMNLLGGLAFAIALVLLGLQGVLEFDKLIEMGSAGLCVLPIALIAFAGMTKAAQVPFQSWLLGAMVAPTPTSALLHSSTMVKAGVFIFIKLAPALGWNSNGIMVMLVGALTFLFCAALAISQSNAKRVLAYSTVSNLGLIVACAGVGTPEAVWAAVFLLVFHAAAKSLLFLCIGVAEHHVGSRDIEEMDNLFVRMPALARLMALGILVMFIAPFGMLVSKWATIVSLVDTSNITLLVILAFGSALTFMFWAKWLGKLLSVAQEERSLEDKIHRSEWTALVLMALISVGLSIGFPFISEYVVVPYFMQVWVDSISGSFAAISFDNLLIMGIIVLAMIVAFAAFFGRSKKRKVPIYLSGVGLDFEKRTFRNSLSGVTEATQRNWHMDNWFGEKKVTPLANTMCIIVLLLGIGLSALSLVGWSL